MINTLPNTDLKSVFVETSDIIAQIPLQQVCYLILQHLLLLSRSNCKQSHPEKQKGFVEANRRTPTVQKMIEIETAKNLGRGERN